jgi:molybdopterin-binding protein
MMSLDLDNRIKVGTKVRLVVNPSHIAIAKDLRGMVSYSNQLKSTIINIENGLLLSSIKLAVEDLILESIITLNSSQRLDLKIGDNVTLLIKASDLSILEVLE